MLIIFFFTQFLFVRVKAVLVVLHSAAFRGCCFFFDLFSPGKSTFSMFSLTCIVQHICHRKLKDYYLKKKKNVYQRIVAKTQPKLFFFFFFTAIWFQVAIGRNCTLYGHCDYLKCMEPLWRVYLSFIGLCVRLWVWHHVSGGLNLQHIKLCKLHFTTVSKHFEVDHSLFVLWRIKGLARVGRPTAHTHSVNTTLHPVFLLAGGSREWCCFPSPSSNSFNSLVVHPRPCPPGRFIRQPISVFGQSGLCKRRKYLLRTPL